jgi:two-component system, OmpR family, response regulator MprA
MKILIVDDDPDMVSSLSRIFKSRGFEVESANDGKGAVAMNLDWQPDAVIMDVRMPRLNGIDACLEVQRARSEVMVILMTGFSDALDEANESIFAEAGRNGRVAVMMKPIDLDRVIAVLGTGEERLDSQSGKDNVVGWLDTMESRSSQHGTNNRSRTRTE